MTLSARSGAHRLTITTLLLCCAGAVHAAAAEPSAEALAKAAQNPVADMISLPFQNNTNFNFGPEEETQNVLNIQPVIPFQVSKDWNVITRTILPIVSQPGLFPGQGRENGLGNTLFTAFLSPRDSGKVIWGVGPAIQLPTATDDQIAEDQWAGGPSAVVLTMPGHWVFGALVSNIWDMSGSQDINFFTLQPFINYNFSKGWYVSTSPIITANWEANSGNEWTVPLGGGVGRIFKLGKQHLNAQVNGYYNVEKPNNIGPDYTLRLQLQFLFPK